MDRLQHRGIICYERALGRMTTEHKEWKGKPTVRYMTSLVHMKPIPTAIGSASDHYLVVSPGGGIRWASVQELARSMLGLWKYWKEACYGTGGGSRRGLVVCNFQLQQRGW